MRCDNIFCIYWDKSICKLDEISLDVCGCCENCIYVDIDDEILKAKRQEILNRLERD